MKKRIMSILVAGSMLAIYSCGGGQPGSGSENQPAKDSAPLANNTESAVTGDATKGKDIYDRTCKACHQENGEGVPKTFPPLAKSDFLANKENVILQVLKGKTGELVVNGETYNGSMPAQTLSDEEVAHVLTYVYSSFGNTGSNISSADIKALRNK